MMRLAFSLVPGLNEYILVGINCNGMIEQSSSHDRNSDTKNNLYLRRTSNIDEPLSTDKVPPLAHARIFFVLSIIILIAILLFYGFFTSHTNQIINPPDSQPYRLEFILTNVLAVLGFGLMLVQHAHNIRQTFFVTAFVISFNLLLGPLFQKFWANVFIYSFKSYTPSTTFIGDQLFFTSSVNKNITLTFARVPAMCSISLLTALFSIIGRIGIVNLLITTFLYNFGFNLNYFLVHRIFKNIYKQPSTPFYANVFDDLQGSKVFSFAAGFGLALIIFYRIVRPVKRGYQQLNEKGEQNLLTGVLNLLGSAISLGFFYYLLDPYYTYDQAKKDNALFNIFIASSASLLSSMAMSCILTGKIGLKAVSSSILSACIYISIIAVFIEYPYIAMIVGSVAGVVTTILLFTHEKINFGNHSFDPKGFLPIVFASCVLGSFIVTLIVTSAAHISNKNMNYYRQRHMIYTIISLGIGLVFGIVCGVFRKFINEPASFTDLSFFSPAFMIFQQTPDAKPRIQKSSNIYDPDSMHQMNYKDDNSQSANPSLKPKGPVELEFD